MIDSLDFRRQITKEVDVDLGIPSSVFRGALGQHADNEGPSGGLDVLRGSAVSARQRLEVVRRPDVRVNHHRIEDH